LKNFIIKFGATWCGPCKVMDPIFDELEKLYKDYFQFVRIDIDKNKEAAVASRITAVPTIIIVKNDKVMLTIVGAKPKQWLIDHINIHCDKFELPESMTKL
jgi:thioredoxin 1